MRNGSPSAWRTTSRRWRITGSGRSGKERKGRSRKSQSPQDGENTSEKQIGAEISANIQRLRSTVSGRPGEWIDLGGSLAERPGEAAGTLRYFTRGGRRVQLKAEELP